MPAIRKHKQNLIIDLVSFACMMLLLLTGIILKYLLPPGSHGESLAGLSRHQWGDVHFWIAVFFVLTITLHLLLHIPWIKASLLPSASRKRRRTAFLFTICLYGFIVLAAGLILYP